MNDYLLSVIGTVLLASLITAIAPEGKTSAIIKGIARLICILTIISPILKFFKTGELEELTIKTEENFFSKNVIETNGTFIQYYSELRIRETQSALEEEFESKYGLFTSVFLEWSLIAEGEEDAYFADIHIDCVHICLEENAEEEVTALMCQYVMENYCSEVLIE